MHPSVGNFHNTKSLLKSEISFKEKNFAYEFLEVSVKQPPVCLLLHRFNLETVMEFEYTMWKTSYQLIFGWASYKCFD